MAAVIIRKKDVERLGKELIKEVYDFLHDEYILKQFPEFLVKQKRFEKDLAYKRFRELNVTTTSSPGSIKWEYKQLEEDKFEEELKAGVEEIKNGTLDIDVIYKILFETILDSEVDEDLYFKNKAFLDIYRVFKNGYIYLED